MWVNTEDAPLPAGDLLNLPLGVHRVYGWADGIQPLGPIDITVRKEVPSFITWENLRGYDKRSRDLRVGAIGLAAAGWIPAILVLASCVSTPFPALLAIKIRSPGSRITKISSTVDQTRASGEEFKLELDIALPYSPGKLVIADFIFVHTLELKSGNTIWSDFNFVKADEISKRSALSKLKEKGGSAEAWLAAGVDTLGK